MENTINQRIREFINSLGINDNQFAKSIGVTQSVIASMFSRNTEPSSKVLVSILNAYAYLSAEWLMRGQGDMRVENNDGMIIKDKKTGTESNKSCERLIPNLIYHYTSMKNLYGILSCQGFKFSSIKNSNDLREKANESGYKSICFCMAGENDNGYDKPRMWAQYGDGNKGVCIGLKTDMLIAEIGEFGNSDIEHFPIRYISSKDVFSISPKSKEALMTKIKDWQNENEYRFISKDCDILKITKDCIDSVYIGELSDEDKYRIASLGINDKIKPYMEQKGGEISKYLFNKFTEHLGESEDISINGLKVKRIPIIESENISYEDGIRNAETYYKESELKEAMIIDNMDDYISAKEKGLKLLPEIDFKLAGGETQLFGTDSILRYWHLPECNDCDVVVQVVGSSMSPTYPPGCWVALKKYSFPENPNSIPFGNVFGIVIRDEDTGDTHAHIKVLRRHKDEKKSKEYWIAHSINTEEFDDFDIRIKDVIGLWVVKQHIVSDML